MTTIQKDLNRVLSRRFPSPGLARRSQDAVTFEVTIFDRSDSMKDYGSVPRTALAEHVAGLKASPAADRIAIAIVTFSDDMRFDVPPAWVEDVIFPERIETDRRTRLYATVRDVLRDLLPVYRQMTQAGVSLNVIVRVYTDGLDNLSSREDQVECVRFVAEGRALGWEFSVTGFGVDAVKIARDMGFPQDQGSAVTMQPTAQSIRYATSQATGRTVTTSIAMPRPNPEKDPSSTPR